MKNKEEEVIKDFDDIFKYIGGWGPFQVRNCSKNQLVLNKLPYSTQYLITLLGFSLRSYKTVVPKTKDNFPLLVHDHPGLLPVQLLPGLRLPLSHPHNVPPSPLVLRFSLDN